MTKTPAPRAWWRRLHEATTGRLWTLVYDKILKPVLLINDSAHAKALGIALGMFVAMTPTVGVQMPIVFVLTSIFSANRLAGIAIVWISNPITMVPLYYGFYLLGRVFIDAEAVDYEVVESVLSPAEGTTRWEALVSLFEALGWPLLVGSLIVATLTAVPTYPLARRFFERRAAKRSVSSKAELESETELET